MLWYSGKGGVVQLKYVNADEIEAGSADFDYANNKEVEKAREDLGQLKGCATLPNIFAECSMDYDKDFPVTQAFYAMVPAYTHEGEHHGIF